MYLSLCFPSQLIIQLSIFFGVSSFLLFFFISILLIIAWVIHDFLVISILLILFGYQTVSLSLFPNYLVWTIYLTEFLLNHFLHIILISLLLIFSKLHFSFFFPAFLICFTFAKRKLWFHSMGESSPFFYYSWSIVFQGCNRFGSLSHLLGFSICAA